MEPGQRLVIIAKDLILDGMKGVQIQSTDYPEYKLLWDCRLHCILAADIDAGRERKFFFLLKHDHSC